MKKIIVLITHYNNLEGLKASLLSISEEFPVDVMIVDDGSTFKPKLNDIENYYTSGNVFIEFLSENSGISVAANKGIKKIEALGYEIIARLDCGDLCFSNRFKKQLNYLEDNPEVKILGGWANVKNTQGELLHILKHPTSHQEIQKKMYLNNMFVNPTVLFYTEVAQKVGYYNPEYSRAAQDYAFFFEAMKSFKAENLPEVLIDYIVEDSSISTKNRKLQVKNRLKIIKRHFYIGFYPIMGILRNLPLLYISRGTANKLKQQLNLVQKK